MSSTTYYVPEGDRKRLAEGHVVTDGLGTLDSTPKLDEVSQATDPSSHIGSHICCDRRISLAIEHLFDPSFDLQEGRGYRVPNGGVYSTLADLASYIGMLSGSGPTTVLSLGSLDKMAAPIAQTTGPSSGSSGSSYGLGLFHRDDAPNVLYHGGATPGFTCNFAFDRITVGLLPLPYHCVQLIATAQP